MTSSLRHRTARMALLAAAFAIGLGPRPGHAQAPSPPNDLAAVFQRVESLALRADRAELDTLLHPTLSPGVAESLAADLLMPGLTRVVVKERDRIVLPNAPLNTGYRTVVEFFLESGDVGRIATYRLDFLRSGPAAPWRIAEAERLTGVEGLYRLKLDATTSYTVTAFRLAAEDFTLDMPRGVAFVARAGGDITTVVLQGDGTMTFSPRPRAEKVQVRILSGDDTLVTPFSVAYIRVNPGDFESFFKTGSLTAGGAPDARLLRRANDFFLAQLDKSFSLDLSDFSRDTWSLLPNVGDLVADVKTRKYRVLTYARANGEAEDITLFDRETRRNISVYQSQRRTEARGGKPYSEDELADYDILDYDIEASYIPSRQWLEGRVRLQLRVRAFALSTLTLRLAEPLVVRSVHTDRHGRVLTVRVRNQNNLLVSLPTAMARDGLLTLTVVYGGRLESMPPDREVVQVGQERPSFLPPDMPQIEPEPRWVFSNRNYWYPQGTVSDYATGRLRLTVPRSYEALATGDADPGGPEEVPGSGPNDPGRRTYTFMIGQPARYFSWVVTRFAAVGDIEVRLPDTPAPSDGHAQVPIAGVTYRGVEVSVIANPRQVSRGRALLPQAADIIGFYGSIVDDFPYPAFTLALVDNDTPGGHSPAYFAMLHQPLPTTPFSWRNDPVHFDDFPQFYLAHEIAHQFWGHAVGWKSYHEQWISEGFAQYFALLYAERRGGPSVLRTVLSRMRASAEAQSAQGPIWLGYRLGHVRNDSRVFRSIVYNKSALVLHSLRRIIGDEAFFAGLQRFYRESRFMKVGTDEARAAFEAASGRSLERFFRAWIREFDVPTVTYSARVEAEGVRVVLEQPEAALHELAVTVTLRYGGGRADQVTVAMTEPRVEVLLKATGPVQSVGVNEDAATLAHFIRR